MWWLVLVMFGVADAHKPSYGGEWGGPDGAYVVEDPSVSIVVYREVTCENPELWLTFDATADEEIWVQLGVPVIDRLEDYRPSMAVLAPGLPQLDPGAVPFDVPAGLGGVIFEPRAVPADFHEPFTGTSSWIIDEEWLTTPESGRGYLVAWHPGRQTGKLWLAMGLVEDFSDVDWNDAAGWSEAVNDFHETGRFSEVPDIEEEVCLDANPPVRDQVEVRSCATQPGGAAWLGLLALPLVWRRRRPSAR